MERRYQHGEEAALPALSDSAFSGSRSSYLAVAKKEKPVVEGVFSHGGKSAVLKCSSQAGNVNKW